MISPLVILPGFGIMFRMARAVMDFPQPLSPITPRVFAPASTVNAQSINRFHDPGADIEFNAQVFYFNQGCFTVSPHGSLLRTGTVRVKGITQAVA